MPIEKLTPEDFPVRAKKTKIVSETGKAVAETSDEEMAKDVAGRLNSDNERDEEDRWA